MAFVDVDWNAESEQSARVSIYKQTLYMNSPQRQVYFDDLRTIDSASEMGGMNGNLLHGKEVSDIHGAANKIRQKRGKETIEFPSRPLMDSVATFFKIPFLLLIDKR